MEQDSMSEWNNTLRLPCVHCFYLLLVQSFFFLRKTDFMFNVICPKVQTNTV